MPSESVSVRKGESQEEKEKRMLKYARLLGTVFSGSKKVLGGYQFCANLSVVCRHADSWCEIRNPWSSEQKDVGVIAAVRFERYLNADRMAL